MRRRHALLGMVALLATALAVPAFGGPSNPVADTFASAKKTSQKALTKAKKANQKAKDAKKAANNANNAAGSARSSAIAADAKATSAQSTADGAAAFNAAADELIPVAVVNVDFDGTVRGESHRAPVAGPPTVGHTPASNTYNIDLPGVPFSASDSAVCTGSAPANSVNVNVTAVGGNVIVELFELDGSADDDPFSCAIYDFG